MRRLEKVQNQMKWDRRRQPRKLPQSFTFLQLEHDEGGRVVNLSEEGLCFETFSPIRTANPVPLWFSFNLRDRIEATGEVVWTDARKEVGGLAFINLSPAARQLIRAHIADAPAEEVPQAAKANGEITLPASPPSSTANLAVVPPFGEVRFSEGPTTKTPESVASEPAVPEVSVSADQAPLIPLERFVSATRSQFLRGLLLGVVITAVVGILVLIFALRSQPKANEREAPAPSSSTNPGADSSSPSAKPELAPQSRAIGPAAPSKSPSGKSPSDSPSSTAAPSLSSASAHPKLSPLTPDQLWEAVQSGNAKAAVALADLYLHGDGVPANCAQARILLQFAAQKNNAEGARKSRELDKSGCPTP